MLPRSNLQLRTSLQSRLQRMPRMGSLKEERGSQRRKRKPSQRST